jgi:hypothetical protein
MMIVAFMTMWWYDPSEVNYLNFTVSYNAHFLNLGSWVSYIPGWGTPNASRYPEPLLLIGLGYIWWMWASVLIGCGILRALKRRWPNLSNLSSFTILGLLIIPIDFVFEVFVFCIPQLWGYPNSIGKFTFFAGEYYQFPMYEPILVAVLTIGCVIPRWFKDDEGRSFVERGVEELRIPPRAKKAVSTLAITGFLHAVIIVAYIVPWSFLSVKADTFAPVPSYLRAGGICGEGTDYACPDKSVPIPHPGSLKIAPDDPRLSQHVRDIQNIGPPGPGQGY